MKHILLLAVLVCCSVAQQASGEDPASVEDYYIDDDQMYYDANSTHPATAGDAAGQEAYQEKTPTSEKDENYDEKEPPKCLKDCPGFPTGADATNVQAQCEFVLGVKEGTGCTNDCTDKEFEEQFSTMREFCADTADSWDGECISDCPGAPGSEAGANAFKDGMSDKNVCTFMLGMQSNMQCLSDCKEDDFTEINSIRDECAQQTAPPEDDDYNSPPVEHVSAVTAKVLVGGFTMDSFLEDFLQRRRLVGQQSVSNEETAGGGACEEATWCERNLPRQPDGTPHENCHSWVSDCPCACAPRATLPAPPGASAAQEIAQQHEEEAQMEEQEQKQQQQQQGQQQGQAQGQAEHGPEEHRGELAFVSGMAHTLLVKRSAIDILNIANREIQVVSDADASKVVSTSPGIEIEFGVRFVAGAEDAQRMVAEKLRSMNLGCMYMFSGRLRCPQDGERQEDRQEFQQQQQQQQQQRAGNVRPGARRRRLVDSDASTAQAEALQAQAPPAHKAVANIEDVDQEGPITEADKKEVDLMEEFRWAFSTELRNSGKRVPDGFTIVTVSRPMIVLFSDARGAGAQAQYAAQVVGGVQTQYAATPRLSNKLSPGATAGVVLLILGAAIVAAIGLYIRFGGGDGGGCAKTVDQYKARREYGVKQRFEMAKANTSSSFSPDRYERDSPRQHPAPTVLDNDDDAEVVDLDEVDSI